MTWGSVIADRIRVPRWCSEALSPAASTLKLVSQCKSDAGALSTYSSVGRAASSNGAGRAFEPLWVRVVSGGMVVRENLARHAELRVHETNLIHYTTTCYRHQHEHATATATYLGCARRLIDPSLRHPTTGCGEVGIPSALGAEDRVFDSRHPDSRFD